MSKCDKLPDYLVYWSTLCSIINIFDETLNQTNIGSIDFPKSYRYLSTASSIWIVLEMWELNLVHQMVFHRGIEESIFTAEI